MLFLQIILKSDKLVQFIFHGMNIGVPILTQYTHSLVWYFNCNQQEYVYF